MKRTLKLLPLFLALMLMFNIGIGVDLPVFADSTKTYSYENYTIDYTVKTEWTGSQDIGVTVTNTSEEPLQGWAFEFEAGGEVKNVSGAEIYDNDGTKYIIKSTSENNTIDPGKSITFGYTVIGTDITAPRAFRLVSKRVVLTDGYSVNIKSNANKKTDFEASITIKNTEKNPSGNNGKKNTGKNVIDAWTLSFDANFTLEKVGRGTFTVDENGRYTITGTGVVSIIRPNVSVQLDISGTKTSNVKPEISNIVLTSVKIDNTITPPEDGEDDETPNTTEITLEAWAEYNENDLALLWASSIQDGKFIIYVSDNGTDFTEFTTVENASSYIYTEGFTKKYFKIVQKYDSITAESPIITAVKTSDGYVDLSYYDTDGDGLSDYEESILLTDKTKPDTDTDGLTDYEEVYLTGTDPLVYDSVIPGTPDAQADIDSDGLTNRDEIDRGTSPVDSDSDYDKLKDGDEVNIHGTDPLKFDTDGDNVSDSDELQLGLNPLSTSTNGIPDNEHTFEQTIIADSEPMEYINNESELEFSATITSAGVAENNLTASESGYSTAMSNPAIIGIIPEFSYTDGLTVSEFTLGAKIPDNLVANTVGTYANENDEFAGIKRLNFFRFFEEINTLLPVETTFDISSNMMYTKTDDLGTYCVMDMEIWLESLTAETETIENAETNDQGGSLPGNTEENTSIVETMSMNKSVMRTANLATPALLTEQSPVVTAAETVAAQNDEEYNVIFCVDTRGYVPNEYSLFNNIVKTTRNKITNSKDREKAHIYWYNEENYVGKMYNGKLDDYDNVTQSMKAFYNKTGAIDVTELALTAINDSNYNKNLETYIFLVFNSEYRLSYANYAKELLDKTISSNIHVSIISSLEKYENTSYLMNLINITQGTIINTKNSDANSTTKVATSVVNYLGAGEAPLKIISSVGLTPLSSDFNSAYIRLLSVNKNHIGDNDLDGLRDWEEIAFGSELISTDDGTVTLPTLQQCMDYAKTKNLLYVEDGLKHFETDDKDFFTYMGGYDVVILPINSDPTMPDSDGDGFLDSTKYFSSFEELNSSEYFNIDDPNPLKKEIIWQWPLYTPSGDKAVRHSANFEEKRKHNDDYTEFFPPYHSAIDIGTAGATGYEVKAMYDGRVTAIGEIGNGGGNSVTITHSINGKQYKTRFCHLANYADGLEYGDYVKAGELIGIAGNTGGNYDIHLDFRIEDISKSVLINPITFDSCTGTDKLVLSPFVVDMFIDIPKNINNVCRHSRYDGCDEAFARIINKYNLQG